MSSEHGSGSINPKTVPFLSSTTLPNNYIFTYYINVPPPPPPPPPPLVKCSPLYQRNLLGGRFISENPPSRRVARELIIKPCSLAARICCTFKTYKWTFSPFALIAVLIRFFWGILRNKSHRAELPPVSKRRRCRQLNHIEQNWAEL